MQKQRTKNATMCSLIPANAPARHGTKKSTASAVLFSRWIYLLTHVPVESNVSVLVLCVKLL